MTQVVNCDLLLHADDSCLVFGDNNVNEIETRLNSNFNSLYDWFVDNKLSIHFGEDKTKSILFGRKNKLPNRKNWTSEEVTSRLNSTPQSRIWALSLMRICLANQWLPRSSVKSTAGSDFFTESNIFLTSPFADC